MKVTKPDGTRYNISDIADMLGVAPSTVSRALNGKKGVGEQQRNKILALAQKLGYEIPAVRQEPAVSALSALPPSVSQKNNTIALVIGDIRNPFYADLEYGIQECLSQEGYQIMIFNSEYDIDKELSILQKTAEGGFSGLFLVTAQSEKMEAVLKTLSLPVVLVNRNFPGFPGDSVFADNFQAGYLAAVHLIDLYHRKIGFIRGPLLSSASTQRFEGYSQAMSNFGLTIDDRFIYDCDLKIESGRQSAKVYLACPPEDRPSAMIIVNDLAALGFIDECRKNGLSIPQDVSVISFDNIIYSSIEGINLTTVSQHVDEMSREAARLMLKQLHGDQTHPERVIITPELVVRGSTARSADFPD